MAREAKRAVVGVMRKLVLALYQVGAKGATFEVGRLFGSKPADLAEQGVGARRGETGVGKGAETKEGESH